MCPVGDKRYRMSEGSEASRTRSSSANGPTSLTKKSAMDDSCVSELSSHGSGVLKKMGIDDVNLYIMRGDQKNGPYDVNNCYGNVYCTPTG